MACCGFYSNYLKTIDGGNNWSIQSDNLGYWLRAAFFTDANHEYAVGDHGVVLKTTDGGSLWNSMAQLAITTAIEFIPHGNSVAYIDNISFDSFHSPTDVPEIPLADGGFRIYPNPAHDHLMVEWNTSDANKASITFTDINGRLLKTVSCDGLAQRASVDIADLPGGFYLVSFRAGNSPRYCKLVVGE